MFRRRRNEGLQQAIQRSRDPELADLHDAVADRRGRVAELELELFEARADLAAFMAELERRIGPLEARVDQLQRELEDARRRDARQAQWGDRAQGDEVPIDVLDQFEKAWRKTGPAPAPKKQPKVEPESQEEIKALYRALAKRFHPDLTVDPEHKQYCEEVMAEINEAYAEGDIDRLRDLMDKPERPVREEEKPRGQVVAELREEISRLDAVIGQLERSLRRLTNSHELQLMLEASIARSQGRDLIQEMARDLRAEIAQLEAELASVE